VLLLHGGPGSGRSTTARRLFDPAAYRIVLFDQRGCGRSTPHASDPATGLSHNTTAHLLADIERLRDHLLLGQCLVFGASWGCTLALAYAQANPRTVTALVLAGITTTGRSEIDWLYRGIAPLFPEQWERFRSGVPEANRDDDLVAAYARLLDSPDPAVRLRAARDWHDWEAAPYAIAGEGPPALWSEPAYIVARARIITHYFRHGAWLAEDQLLNGMAALADIPGLMVQGRVDLEAPPVTAWKLPRVWPAGELVVVAGAGHSLAAPGLSAAIVEATDRFAAARYPR
jgi:proline iminopeptidase